MHRVVEISQYELERGKPTPSVRHSFVQSRLMVAFDGFEDRYNIFPSLISSWVAGNRFPTWQCFPKNVYVFSSPEDYQMFRADQTLVDSVLGIELELSKIFV